jgi:hypothetical protein
MFTSSSEVVYYIGMKFKKFQYIVDSILFGNIVIFYLFSKPRRCRATEVTKVEYHNPICL